MYYLKPEWNILISLLERNGDISRELAEMRNKLTLCKIFFSEASKTVSNGNKENVT